MFQAWESVIIDAWQYGGELPFWNGVSFCKAIFAQMEAATLITRLLLACERLMLYTGFAKLSRDCRRGL